MYVDFGDKVVGQKPEGSKIRAGWQGYGSDECFSSCFRKLLVPTYLGGDV